MDLDKATRGQLALRRAEAPDDAISAMTAIQASEIVELARKFVEMPGEEARFLVLLGARGTGKTVAAVLVLSEMLRRQDAQSRPSGGDIGKYPPGMFIRANTLARLSAYDQADRAWFETMIRTPCLVIDDLGAEVANETFKAQLYELFDRRYSRSRRTVITSNLDKSAFANRYGGRISDRLKEKGLSMESVGESMRKRLVVP